MRIPWKIRVSPRFELLLALWSALSEKAVRHGEWRLRVRERLSPDFDRTIDALGGSAELWILFFDFWDCELSLDLARKGFAVLEQSGKKRDLTAV